MRRFCFSLIPQRLSRRAAVEICPKTCREVCGRRRRCWSDERAPDGLAAHQPAAAVGVAGLGPELPHHARRRVGQHGQSAVWAVPEVGSRASSRRAWRLRAAQHSQEVGAQRAGLSQAAYFPAFGHSGRGRARARSRARCCARTCPTTCCTKVRSPARRGPPVALPFPHIPSLGPGPPACHTSPQPPGPGPARRQPGGAANRCPPLPTAALHRRTAAYRRPPPLTAPPHRLAGNPEALCP